MVHAGDIALILDYYYYYYDHHHYYEVLSRLLIVNIPHQKQCSSYACLVSLSPSLSSPLRTQSTVN